MGDRSMRPPRGGAPGAKTESDDPTYLPPAQEGIGAAARYARVGAERSAAAAQIQRTMRVWRKAEDEGADTKSDEGADAKSDEGADTKSDEGADAKSDEGAGEKDGEKDGEETADAKEEPAEISAKLEGVGRKIFRSADDEEVPGELVQLFNSKRDAPTWPANFRPKTPPSSTRNNVNNAQLLAKLRAAERGDWKKVYEDGYAGADRISMHYFQSPSGKVFNVKRKPGWSNGG